MSCNATETATADKPALAFAPYTPAPLPQPAPRDREAVWIGGIECGTVSLYPAAGDGLPDIATAQLHLGALIGRSSLSMEVSDLVTVGAHSREEAVRKALTYARDQWRALAAAADAALDRLDGEG